MIFEESAVDITWAFLVFILGLIVSLIYRKKVGVNKNRCVALYLWHTAFCLVYYYYALNNVADSNGYYRKAIVGNDGFGFGTAAVDWFNFIIVSGLGLSYLTCFFLYNIFGSIGLITLSGSLSRITIESNSLVRKSSFLICFLPSMSFWSASIGKDSIAFMGCGFLVWASLNFNKRIAYLVSGVLLILLVRPHIASLILLAICASAILSKGLNKLSKLLILLLGVGSSIVVLPFALKKSGLSEGAGTREIEDYILHRQSVNMNGGSSLDISSMSLFQQMYSYMYRPLPYEAHSLTALIGSFDNMIMLSLSFLGCISWLKVFKKRRRINVKNVRGGNFYFLLFYSISIWIVLSVSTPNLGIAMRQKQMFIPVILALIFLGLSQIYKKR